jgi:hypothetical protein
VCFRVNDLRFSGLGEGQHTHSGCAGCERISVELTVN